ncbi:ABC transporter ATP-binding protein [Niallia oryzisoli]|uniref:ABC transporter ATP-binding protein n=1 Tax=Niallia oryzisoli TaxID=1737571 RepID=A0ABZ2CEG2_9BACI
MLKQRQQKLRQMLKPYFNTTDLKKCFRLLKPFLVKQWNIYLLMFVSLVIDIFLTIAFAWFFGNLTDTAIKGDMNRLKMLVPIGIGFTLTSVVNNYIYIYFDTLVSNGLKRELQNYLFQHILRLPVGTVANLRSGNLLSYFTNDIHRVDGLSGSNLINLIRLPITYVAVLIYLIQINWVLCLITVIVAPVAVIGGAFFGFILKKSGREIHELIADINHTLNETFQGLQVIRSFTLEKNVFRTFSRKNKDYYHLELKNAKLQGWYSTAGYLLNSAVFLFSLCLGAYFISEKTMTVGNLLTFINLVGYLVNPLTGLASQWAGFQRAIAAIERVIELLEKPVASDELPSFSPAIKEIHSIQFKDLTFAYEENKLIFEEFNLQIPAGKVTAFVGPSGAGKSTLFNLLQGFYQPKSGGILINGIPTAEFSFSDLRSAIAHVPQETFLFGGTFRDNLVIARPSITEEEMIEACRSAYIHDFILSLPDGYDTQIGERGVKLSGGQKQRMAIARAILKDAPILLLDEATSALDGETEYLVKAALDKLMENKTTLVIAHRLSTIQHADRIFVLDKGKIVQEGTHEELIRQKGLYQKLHSSSFIGSEMKKDTVGA